MSSVKDCGDRYEELAHKRVNYKFVLRSENILSDGLLIFRESEFLHLSGLHKLKDVIEQQNKNKNNRPLSSFILHQITHNKFTDSTIESSEHYYDDTNKTASEIEEERKSRKVELICKSDIYNRLNSLETLDDMFCSASKGTTTLKVYHWLRDDKGNSNDLRPKNSSISADLLFEFQDASTNEFVCFFAKNTDKANVYTGVSVFRSNETYSKDNSVQQRVIRQAKEYELLSLVRTDKDKNKMDIVHTPAQKMKVYKQAHDDKQAKIAEKEEICRLHNEEKMLTVNDRNRYLKAEQKGNSYDVALARQKYTLRFIYYATNHIKYPDDYLTNLIVKLQEQLKDASLSDKHHCVQFELDMTILAQMSRELYVVRESEVKGEANNYIDIVLQFMDKATDGYEDYAIAVLQKQKESYDTKEKKKSFSKEEISQIKQKIDEEIDIIDNGRNKGDIDKPHGNNNKKITPLTEKPSKTKPLKQIIQTKLSQFKNTISNIKERISNYISSILNNPSSSGGSGSGTPYAYAGSDGGCTAYTIGEAKEASVLQEIYTAIVQPTYTPYISQMDAIKECNRLIALMEEMTATMKENAQSKKQEVTKPAPKELSEEKKDDIKPEKQKIKKADKTEHDDR